MTTDLLKMDLSCSFKSVLNDEQRAMACSLGKRPFREAVPNLIPIKLTLHAAFVSATQERDAWLAMDQIPDLTEFAGQLGWKKGGTRAELSKRMIRYREMTVEFESHTIDTLAVLPAKPLDAWLDELKQTRLGNKRQKAARLLSWAAKMRLGWDVRRAEVLQAEGIQLAARDHQPISKVVADEFGIKRGLEHFGYMPDADGNYTFAGTTMVEFRCEKIPLGTLIGKGQDARRISHFGEAGVDKWKLRIEQAKAMRAGAPPLYEGCDPDKLERIATKALADIAEKRADGLRNLEEITTALTAAGYKMPEDKTP